MSVTPERMRKHVAFNNFPTLAPHRGAGHWADSAQLQSSEEVHRYWVHEVPFRATQSITHEVLAKCRDFLFLSRFWILTDLLD
jgi:hypothetical protein